MAQKRIRIIQETKLSFEQKATLYLIYPQLRDSGLSPERYVELQARARSITVDQFMANLPRSLVALHLEGATS